MKRTRPFGSENVPVRPKSANSNNALNSPGTFQEAHVRLCSVINLDIMNDKTNKILNFLTRHVKSDLRSKMINSFDIIVTRLAEIKTI